MKSLATPLEYLFGRSFPREVAVPQRIGLVRDLRGLCRFVNEHNGRTDVFCSVSSFRGLRAVNKPDYSTAAVESVFMDFDGMPAAIPDAFRLHNWLLDRGVEHAAALSGGGAHVFVRAEPAGVRLPAAALNGAQTYLARVALAGAAASLDVPSIFGDTARVIRVPNTWNLGRRRWDVPLTAAAFEDFAELAQSGRAGAADAALRRMRPIALSLDDFVQPGDPLDVSEWDSEGSLPARANGVVLAGASDDGLEDSGVAIVVGSAAISRLVGPEMRHEDRASLIFYLFERGYSLGEVVRYLRENLSPKKYHHAIYSERQPQRIYERFVR